MQILAGYPMKQNPRSCVDPPGSHLPLASPNHVALPSRVHGTDCRLTGVHEGFSAAIALIGGANSPTVKGRTDELREECRT